MKFWKHVTEQGNSLLNERNEIFSKCKLQDNFQHAAYDPQDWRNDLKWFQDTAVFILVL